MNMIPNRRFLAALCGATCIAGALFARPAVAQEAPKTAKQSQMTRIITLHNMFPSAIAWRLDPAHHPEPYRFQASRANRIDNPLIVDKANPRMEMVKLPAGINSIIARDPDLSLLASGTRAGLDELERVVARLDKPLPAFEIEGRFIASYNTEDYKRFGLSLSPDPKKRYSVIPLSAATLTQINEEILRGQIRVLSAPSVPAVSNLTAATTSTQSTPIFVDIKPHKDEPGQTLNFTGPNGQLIAVNESLTFMVTPTSNNDGSISLELAPARFLKLSALLADPGNPQGQFLEDPRVLTSAGAQSASQNIMPPRVLEGALVTATMREGQTVAITGFTTSMFTGFYDSADKIPQEILLLVTARIMPRAGNKTSTAAKP